MEHTRQMTEQEGKFILSKIVFADNTQQIKVWSCLGQICLGGNFVWCRSIHLSFTKTTNKLISTKNPVFITLVDLSETVESQLIYNCLKIGTFQPKQDKIDFFSTFAAILRCYANDNLELVQGVNFEFIKSLKNNGTKYLLFFDGSCEEIYHS